MSQVLDELAGRGCRVGIIWAFEEDDDNIKELGEEFAEELRYAKFSLEEIRAAVEEAEAANVYVAGHAYTARAINRGLDCGVRSIEHGNLMDASSIALFERTYYRSPEQRVMLRLTDLWCGLCAPRSRARRHRLCRRKNHTGDRQTDVCARVGRVR